MSSILHFSELLLTSCYLSSHSFLVHKCNCSKTICTTRSTDIITRTADVFDFQPVVTFWHLVKTCWGVVIFMETTFFKLSHFKQLTLPQKILLFKKSLTFLRNFWRQLPFNINQLQETFKITFLPRLKKKFF